MLECINKECTLSVKGRCQDKELNNHKANCSVCIKPTHTLSHAEEQLQNEIDKEEVCYNVECKHNSKTGVCVLKSDIICFNKIKEPPVLNYEEEYKKLKADNEKLIDNAIKTDREIAELKRKHENQRVNIKCGIEDNKKLKDKNETLELCNKQLQNENEGLKEQIELQKKQLENETNRYKSVKKELEELINKTITPNYKAENKALKCQLQEAKKYIEIKENEMQKLRKKLEDAELLGKMIKKLVEAV